MARHGDNEFGAIGRMSAHADRSGEASPTPTDENLPKPYFKADGTLVIPMMCDPKYHYWKKGGQAVCQTREELRGTQQ